MIPLVKYSFIFSLLLCCCALSAAPMPETPVQLPELALPAEPIAPQKDPLLLLNQLMETTAQRLEGQKKSVQLLTSYRESKKNYLINTKDKKNAAKFVKEAHQLLENIKEHHLSDLFPPTFISELSYVSQFSEKKSISSP